MATKIRRSFTDEFKQEAVSLLASSGRPLTQVARELGIQPSMLPDIEHRLTRSVLRADLVSAHRCRPPRVRPAPGRRRRGAPSADGSAGRPTSAASDPATRSISVLPPIPAADSPTKDRVDGAAVGAGDKGAA